MNNTNNFKRQAPRIVPPIKVKQSYYAIVWKQLRKNRIAVFGIICIALLIFVAVFSPFIANDNPYIFITPDGETSFPAFASLFDRTVFENSVDIFFNLLLIILPVYLVIMFILKRIKPLLYKEYFNGILVVSIVGFLILFTIVLPFTGSRPKINYHEILMETEHKEDYFYLFPPVPFSQKLPYTGAKTLEEPQIKDFLSTHLLGTDMYGKDILASMIYGSRISLTIGIVAVSIYIMIGILFGSIAGYYGGRIDLLISRFIEIMMCFPTFFLIITIAALIEERSIFHIMIIIGFTGWTGVSRLVRGEFLKQKAQEYTIAAQALGLPQWKTIFGHILPNSLGPVLVSATFGIAAAILVESSIAFLGLGDASASSWGELLNQGRTAQKLWLILPPGLAIFFVVSIFNLVGEGLRDALDPRLHQS